MGIQKTADRLNRQVRMYATATAAKTLTPGTRVLQNSGVGRSGHRRGSRYRGSTFAAGGRRGLRDRCLGDKRRQVIAKSFATVVREVRDRSRVRRDERYGIGFGLSDSDGGRDRVPQLPGLVFLSFNPLAIPLVLAQPFPCLFVDERPTTFRGVTESGRNLLK